MLGELLVDTEQTHCASVQAPEAFLALESSKVGHFQDLDLGASKNNCQGKKEVSICFLLGNGSDNGRNTNRYKLTWSPGRDATRGSQSLSRELK